MNLPFSRAICALICLVSIFILYLFFDFSADDSYIVLRYAENFVRFGELSFNQGEKINALTSPLHAIIAILLSYLTGAYIVVAGKLLMVILFFASVNFVVKPYWNQPLLILFPLISMLLSPFLLMWTVGGLETIILLFLITLICSLSLKPATPIIFYWICFLSGLAFLTRFDSLIFTGPFLLVYFFKTIKEGRTFGLAVKGTIFYSILPLIWIALAFYYFHDPIPTSFYLKLARSFSFETIFYCFQFFIYSGFIPFYFLGLFILFIKRNAAYFKDHFKKYAHLHIAFLGVALYGFSNAQVHMMFGYRLLLPYTAVLMFIVLDILKHAISQQKEDGLKFKPAYYILLVLFGSFQLIHSYYVYNYSINGITASGEYRNLSLHSYKEDFLPVMKNGAEDLKNHIENQPKFEKRQASFLTFAEGLIPYYLPDMYIYGRLISLRKNDRDFDYHFIEYSDYFYWFGNKNESFLKDVLSKPHKYILISNHQIIFDEKDLGFYIFFNPDPKPYQLTKYIRDQPQDIFSHLFYKLNNKNLEWLEKSGNQ